MISTSRLAGSGASLMAVSSLSGASRILAGFAVVDCPGRRGDAAVARRPALLERHGIEKIGVQRRTFPDALPHRPIQRKDSGLALAASPAKNSAAVIAPKIMAWRAVVCIIPPEWRWWAFRPREAS